jgi:two-component system, OmpR family, sensor kinase
MALHSGMPFALCLSIVHLPHAPNELRLLKTLQEFMQLPALQMQETFTEAAHRIAEALPCEKVDVFMFDESKQTLRAIGTSRTPMGRLQQALGLDVLALANGGSVVRVFKTGNSELQADTLTDPEELRGFVTELGVRSSIGVASLTG